MKSTDKKHFDRVVWMGRPPTNKAREQLLSQLLVFLGYEGGLAGVYVPNMGRQLVLGNSEDFNSEWPRPDGQGLFVGLFSDKYPNSGTLLNSFDASEVSFYLHEKVNFPDIGEYLEDLLLS